jgi:hypothetical protein
MHLHNAIRAVMRNTESMGSLHRRLPSRWSNTATALPTDLDALRGPASGIATLPPDLAWSGRRTFDLDDAEQRYLFLMTVLTSAVTTEHHVQWLNAGVLRAEWNTLRLPRALRRAWEDRFPTLST